MPRFSNTQHPHDIAIVGAGIMGLLTAYELAHRGARVLLLEQQKEAGQEASWAGGGILSPLYPWRMANDLNPLLHASLKRYPSLIQTLQKNTAIDPQWHSTGLLILDTEETSQALSWSNTQSLPIERLDHTHLQNNHTYLNTRYTSGLWLPWVYQVRNPRLLQALRQSLSQCPHVTLREASSVTHFKTQGRRLTHAVTAQDDFQADHFVLCSGAWSNTLLQTLKYQSPITPVAGQMLLLKINHGDTPTAILLHEDRYVIPRQDGFVLVGSTLEHHGFEKMISEKAKSTLFQSAIHLCPSLHTAECIHQWAGLRPYTPQGIPLIGALPDYENAWINAGHFRQGLTLAPASCALLADLLLKKTPCVNPKPYAPIHQLQNI